MRSAASRKRNSRWDHSPILDRSGTPKLAAITERDIEGIFKPLLRYRYLPVDYLHAFAGGSLDYLVNRLNLLAREPNRYVARPQQQRANAAANHRRLIYELADKGWRVMQERGISSERSRAPANFAHELMTSELMASFEFGSSATGVRHITWPDILQSRNLPEETRLSPKPYNIPVTASFDGVPQATHGPSDSGDYTSTPAPATISSTSPPSLDSSSTPAI